MKNLFLLVLTLSSLFASAQINEVDIEYAAVRGKNLENVLESMKTAEFNEHVLFRSKTSDILRVTINWESGLQIVSIVKLADKEKPAMCIDGYFNAEDQWDCGKWIYCTNAETYESGNMLWLFYDEEDEMYYFFYVRPIR